MKINFPVSLLGSALAFYGRQDGPALQARQVGQPVNGTESLTTVLQPLVNVDDPACGAAIAAIESDPATVKCCGYMKQLNNQTLESVPAASGWLDGFCSATCPSQYNASAAQLVAGCDFKPQPGMSPAEVENMFQTAADIMTSVTCLKDPTGNYCILAVWQSLQANATVWASNTTSVDPEVVNQILGNLCDIPCGILLLDAIQEYTGYSSSAVCSMLSSGLPSILPPFPGPSATSTPVAAGPPSTSSPAAPTGTTTPLPGPPGRLVRRLHDLLK